MASRPTISGQRGRAIILCAAGTVIFPAAAVAAEIAAAASVASDYDYRGVTQTANQPALQLTMEYAAEPLHLEIWTSNVQFAMDRGAYDAGHLELAYSADLTLNRNGWLRWNIGINYATYPGLHPASDYAEVWGTATHGPLSASVHYAWDYSEVHPRLGAYYGEINGSWPLHGTHFAAVAHIGMSWGPYWSATNNRQYSDYALGMSAGWRRCTVLVEAIDTHGYQSIGRGSPFSGKGKLLASICVALSSAAQ